MTNLTETQMEAIDRLYGYLTTLREMWETSFKKSHNVQEAYLCGAVEIFETANATLDELFYE